MVAIRKANQPDSTVWFDREEKVGVLIQFQFKRALHFVNGLTVDTLNWTEDTTAKTVDDWITNKRTLYKKEKEHANAPYPEK
jgi:hypothetical protein